MQFQPNLASLEQIFNLVRTSLSGTEEIKKKIELAVEEVVVNIISYAHSPFIEVEVKERDGVAYITIKDWGDPFNPLAHKDDLHEGAPIEELEEGGLGIFFLKKIMDEITYERLGDQNILKIKKTLLNREEAAS